MKKTMADINKEKEIQPEVAYAFYSKVLNKVFDTVEDLQKAEAAHAAELKAKEDKAAQKKADAKKVEDAFKALNLERKMYKENMVRLTERYKEELKNLKDSFATSKNDIEQVLADAEKNYAKELKAFTDAHPEGYHLTLKDGDFETTISGQSTSSNRAEANHLNILDLFNLFFKQI
jgi:hypothetical protein